MNSVIQLAFAHTPGLEQEMKEMSQLREETLTWANEIQSPVGYVSKFLKAPHGLEFEARTKEFKTPLKILDVGCGRGESAVLLAMKGHEVHAVEPCLPLCEIIQSISHRFSLPLKVYQGIGETLDQVEENAFDLCIFNASLHHCDEPLKALKYCHAKLKAGGKILLLNEPILKFYRSKKWYHNALEKFPEQMGHYGGNEHIYYYGEYINLLKQSGFLEVKGSLHERLSYPQAVILGDIHKNWSDEKLLVKLFALTLFKKMIKNKVLFFPLLTALKKLSLIPVSFEAKK
jgi:SAM-dependent methyltransferase